MVGLAGVALVVLLLIALAGSGSVSAEQVVAAASNEEDPKNLEQAAEVLDDRGYPTTAEVIRRRARRLRGGANNSPVKSPIREASDEAWKRFVLTLAKGRLDGRSPAGYLGKFGLGLRRLQDLGYVRSTKRDNDGSIRAEWNPPHSEREFLTNPKLQYQAFVRSMVGHRAAVLLRHAGALGRVYGGRPATLSGLLGVAHQAGLDGLGLWLQAGGDERRYPKTTAMYRQTVGLF